MVWETGVQSQIDSYQRLEKRYLMPPLFKTQHNKVWGKGMWSNPGKDVVPSLTPWCSI